MIRSACFVAAFLFAGLAVAALPHEKGGRSLTDSAHAVLSTDASVADAALKRLREAGPAGLEALLDAHADEIAANLRGPRSPRWQRLSAAIDKVAAQRDAYLGGLYWYTDFHRAKAAARETGRPILSLRLLGRLEDEYSCANSRFFRTVLYANAEVAGTLRKHFVLHWQSVRPVPVVTIDMGDGRTIRRTITGNSIHYILDAQGRPVDAVPGLYGARAFLQAIEAARSLEAKLRNLSRQERGRALAQWHAEASSAAAAAWANDLDWAGLRIVPVEIRRGANNARGGGEGFPDARVAARLAVGKRVVETPIVESIAARPDPAVLAARTDDAAWASIAALHADEAALDHGSRTLIRAKHPAARSAGQRARTKLVVEDPLVAVIEKFQRSIAEDTVRNEYTFHRQIHDWFASERSECSDVDVLNEKVYAELFLTPSSDAWLGLLPEDTYSALEGDGFAMREAAQ